MLAFKHAPNTNQLFMVSKIFQTIVTGESRVIHSLIMQTLSFNSISFPENEKFASDYFSTLIFQNCINFHHIVITFLFAHFPSSNISLISIFSIKRDAHGN